MKITKILLPVLAAAVLTGCAKKAPDAVNDLYSSLQKGDLENVIQYVFPDSVGELTDAEKEMFTYPLSGIFSKDLNTIKSFEIVSVNVDTLGNHADFEVKTVHGQSTYNEKGSMNRNPETGHWTLRLDSIYTENPKEATNEAMPQLRAAAFAVMAGKGIPYYMYEHAMTLEKNLYGTKDPSQSFNLYKKAAEAGYAHAYYNLGNCYNNGYGTDRDLDLAFEAYKKGAELNDFDCTYQLARCYENGRGTSRDYDKTFELAKKLNSMDPQSTYLGNCYLYGIGTPKDPERGFQEYMKTADAGSAAGMYNVAWCYDNGTGVEKDYAKAIEWYKKAADNGDTDSLCNLGWMYADGKGVEKDYNEAYRLFSKGADKGDSWCMNGLAILYRDGKGVNKDLDKARDLFEKAVSKGNSAAKNNLDNLWKYF